MNTNHLSINLQSAQSYLNEALEKFDDMIDFLVPQYIKEGKSQLVIAVGCTGGMHRSVYIANHIFDLLAARGYQVNVEHRDLMKNDVWEHVREES